MSKLLRTTVEGYRKTDAPAVIATRFEELVANAMGRTGNRAPRVPKFVKDKSATQFPGEGGGSQSTWEVAGKFAAQSRRILVD